MHGLHRLNLTFIFDCPYIELMEQASAMAITHLVFLEHLAGGLASISMQRQTLSVRVESSSSHCTSFLVSAPLFPTHVHADLSDY